ncbi:MULTISPECIES: energy transducer TonB [unclassified Luteimonas]
MRLHLVGAALVAALVTSACGQQAPSVEDAETGESFVVPSEPAEAVDLSRRSNAELIEAADHALREGRLYAPAGDSAIEYWLEARNRDPDDAAVVATVVELQPYLLIACEQAIARNDLVEAQRLHGLIATSDPEAPALQRLATGITAAQAQAERAVAAAQAIAGQAAATQRAEVPGASPATSTLPAPPVLATTGQPQPPSASPSPPASTREPPKAPPQARSTPAQERTSTAPPAALPRALHQPPPRYPSLALNRRIEGAVQVAFTIRPDGSVEDARVLSADPPGVFDRSALAAVGGYRFEPIGRRMASTVTLRFSLAP